jgi:hypothetical protein
MGKMIMNKKYIAEEFFLLRCNVMRSVENQPDVLREHVASFFRFQ